MKILIFLLVSFLSIFNSVSTEENRKSITKDTFIATCPSVNDNESTLEDFLTEAYWAEERLETNTDHLTMSQVSLLTDTNYSSICASFNTIYQEAFDEKNGIGETANDISYFRADTFYFVVITPRQSDDPNYIIFGTSYIHVYDQNISLIEAYAF